MAKQNSYTREEAVYDKMQFNMDLIDAFKAKDERLIGSLLEDAIDNDFEVYYNRALRKLIVRREIISQPWLIYLNFMDTEQILELLDEIFPKVS